MKYSAVFQPCPWPNDLPLKPQEYSIYSSPGSEISDSGEDRVLKGLSRFTYSSPINSSVVIICIAHCFSVTGFFKLNECFTSESLLVGRVDYLSPIVIDEKQSSERSGMCPGSLSYLEWTLLLCPRDHTTYMEKKRGRFQIAGQSCSGSLAVS